MNSKKHINKVSFFNDWRRLILALPFFLGGFITALLYLVLPFKGQVFVVEVWKESIASNTITFFLLYSMIVPGIFLLMGSVKERTIFDHSLREIFVKKPIEFGQSFAAVGFGLLFGILFVVFWVDSVIGMTVFIGGIYMIFAFFIMSLFQQFTKVIDSNKQTRFLGLVMILLPLILICVYPWKIGL